MKLLVALLLSAAVGAPIQANALPVYDVAADFSFATNPNAPWSYGRETTLGAAFAAYSAQSTVAGIQLWQSSAGSNTTPNVAHNPTAGTIVFASTTFLPGQVSLHPGPLNEYSVIRFVVPTTGSYQLNSSFNMRSNSGIATNSTDVHVLLNNNTGSQLYSGTVTGFNDVDVYNAVLSLSAGDLLDFAVGPNGNVPNQSFLGDTTQLAARLELLPNAAPVPGTALLLLLGLSALGLNRRKRGVA